MRRLVLLLALTLPLDLRADEHEGWIEKAEQGSAAAREQQVGIEAPSWLSRRVTA